MKKERRKFTKVQKDKGEEKYETKEATTIVEDGSLLCFLHVKKRVLVSHIKTRIG